MTVWIQNNGSSSVKMKVIHVSTNLDYGYETVAAGDQLTEHFHMENGKGIYGKFRVYVTTDDGSTTDINVYARQY